MYKCARDPKTKDEPPDMNYEFSLIYMLMWAWALAGMIFGIIIATLLYSYLGLATTMSSAGLFLFPCWLYLL